MTTVSDKPNYTGNTTNPKWFKTLKAKGWKIKLKAATMILMLKKLNLRQKKKKNHKISQKETSH